MTNRPRRIVLSADLVARLRKRDESAYRELFDHAWPALFAIAAAIVQSREIAEDVVQDALFRLWQQGDQFAPQGELGDYLVTAVRNAALTALRDDRRLRRRHERVISENDADSSPDEDPEALWADEIAKLRRIVAELTEHQRTAFTLRYGQGMTNAEIARILGISLKGAEQLTARLKRMVRDRLLDPSM